MNRIVTIGREFGSGGREIGLQLAKRLSVPFYDKELVTLAAKDGSFAESFLSAREEQVSPVLPAFSGPHSTFSVYQESISDRIFFAQTDVIRSLAKNGACVIVGRCADYVLRGEPVRLFNVFCYADMADRIQRKVEMDVTPEGGDMERHIRAIDRRRARYYMHYTGRKWGDMHNHDLCVNTSVTGVEGAVEAILAALSALPDAKD